MNLPVIAGRGDLIIGHRAGWPRQPDLAPLAAMFEQAAVPCRIADDIAAEQWTKMVMNCAWNALSALTRAPYGSVQELFQRAAHAGVYRIELAAARRP